MDGLLQKSETGNSQQQLAKPQARKGLMRFTVRSLGGKLVIGAALTLLFCLLLFTALSWWLVKLFYERDASNDARTHLITLSQTYREQSEQRLQQLLAQTARPEIIRAFTQAGNGATLQNSLARDLIEGHWNAQELVDVHRHVILQVGGAFANNLHDLLTVGLAGNASSQVLARGHAWERVQIAPVRNATGQVLGVLLASELLDNYFVTSLAQNGGLHALLCQGRQILGVSEPALEQGLVTQASVLCQPATLLIVHGNQSFFTFSGAATASNQLASSSPLTLVAVEPLYNFNAHVERVVEIMLGIGVFVIALGVTLYAVVTRTYFVRPLRLLQNHVQELTPDYLDSNPPADEIGRLTRSLSQISQSLALRENESHGVTRQMSDLLAMGDILLSTLDLQHLLGEVVTRLGPIMYARGVVLHLYGREMTSPWAVAQWTDTSRFPAPGTMNGEDSPVAVHIDPRGDVTLAVTTKMSAISVPARRPVRETASGKRKALRAPKLTPPPPTYTPPYLHIPRPALRELDMTLVRMAMQKQKIVYAEDIAAIYHERGEAWAQNALDVGYRSVISVPMLLQEQAIGAFILYDDEVRSINQSDSFLLTTAAIQIAMAIQNALLFIEVKDKNAALERVNHLKSQFLATVTHELRTPLHSIISYGALILEGFLDGELTSEQEEHIQFMVNRAEDLSRLVDDMLDLSKIEADRLEVKPEPVNLEKSLHEVVNQLKPMANNKGLGLTLEAEEALPMALADSHRTRQVVLNLVSNALKFTEKGGVTIRCNVLDRYDMLRISVHDTGIGISPAALDYIFEAFRQADGSTTRRFGGTGLGLTIARKLIELQGGEVAVESMVGRGSTFSFTLPISIPARVQAGAS